MRAIERLKDLERMQKTNEEKLKADLLKLDSAKHTKKTSIFQMISNEKDSHQLLRQQKKIDEYSEKIKFYEKSFFKT